ncbi:MAG: HAE1 family hydrophobic/amphiphilic exporter-1 [Porticoccaceae bacterium]|jgi:HAE1 family hydrophobic/amphiphilic exporter-1
MNNLIRWAVKNSPGMNTLMIALLVIGGFCLRSMRREEFPEFELERIVIAVPYPGASPQEVEEGICLKIEEAVRSVDGIKKQTSVASEGSGSVILELESSVKDVQRVLNEVRSEIDRIPSFPELAEDPEVEQITMRKPAIRLAVIGPESDDPDAELKLREVAEQVRDDLLQLPTVTQANLMGTRAYQIDVEISEAKLRSHGLSLSRVADIIRRENLELPGGLLKAESGNILLRGRHKRVTGAEIAKVPLVTREDGVVLTVADLGIVKDEFADTVSISRVDGKPGLVISVNKTSNEDLLTIVETVRKFATEREMPAGYSLHPWKDAGIAVQDRMNLLARNGLQGLILVFIMLAIFLEFRLAFWVSMGIPVSILGACTILLYCDQTLNMLSMFAFMMALGIVVDDAIVTGENIYAHREQGKPFTQAAIDGTIEVFPSVLGSILTSVIAFLPLMFVSGIMGKFIAVLPVTIIAMLAISLFESTFILPGHLAHEKSFFYRAVGALLYPLKPVVWFFNWLNAHSARLLDRFIESVYLKIVRFLFRYPAIVVSLALTVLIVSFGFVKAGMIPFVIFPKLDKNDVRAQIVYQDGTPSAVTDAATKRLEAAIETVAAKYQSTDGGRILKTMHRTVGSTESSNPADAMPQGAGSHIGSVSLELVDTSERSIRSSELLAEWRAAAGDFPGADSITFDSPNMGPGGVPIEFKLLSRNNDLKQLESAVEAAKLRLAEYPGVFDVADDSTPGKVEFRIKIKERARAMGIPLFELADTVRASYFGAEVMRLQRGRHEVKLMVRYPDAERRSLANFDQIRVRGTDGAEYPITELADIEITRSASEINRVDQLRSITVKSDLNEQVEGANAKEIVADLKTTFFMMPEEESFFEKLKSFFWSTEEELEPTSNDEKTFAEKYPGVRVRWEGQEAESQDSITSLMIGLALAMVGMYVLLTIQFTSYLQPILIMMIIPFGCIGAIAGHFWLGLPVTMFSLFGLVALTGVVVNDSIVLIDFINQRMADGMPLHDAIIDAGRRRFRPVLLTSVTTVAGLTPILLETSLQAQFLIPMAASLSFGIMTSTVLVLILVPSFYCIFDILFKIGPRPESGPTPESAIAEPAIAR